MIFERKHETLDASQVVTELLANHPIHLEQCQIRGTIDLYGALIEAGGQTDRLGSRIITFSQDIHFINCTFEEDIAFSGPWEHPDSLRVMFKGDVRFNMSVFNGQARFIGATFEKAASFDGCIFRRVCAFREAVFCGRTLFRTVSFEGYVLFNRAQFKEDVRFINTCFNKGVNFTVTIFSRSADFQGVYSQNRIIPQISGVCFQRKRFGDDVTFWRFIKQVCQEAGLYRDAGECFYKEQCAIFWQRLRGTDYRRLSTTSKVLRWIAGIRLMPELLLGRFLFGYGERPVRVLAAAVLLIVGCGLFYSSSVAQFSAGSDSDPIRLTLLEGIYFSTTTFTTLGLGDLAPAPETTLVKIMVMFEAFIGAFLIALFVVCFWRRFSRD